MTPTKRQREVLEKLSQESTLQEEICKEFWDDFLANVITKHWKELDCFA